jgi:hypothetical protein
MELVMQDVWEVPIIYSLIVVTEWQWTDGGCGRQSQRL